MYRAWQEDTRPGIVTDISFPYYDWIKVIEDDFIDPTPLCKPFPILTFRGENAYPPADYFECCSMHIVSEKFVELMNDFNVPAEYHLVRMFHKNEEITTQYFLMHILQAADCIDREQSEIVIDNTDYIDNFET